MILATEGMGRLAEILVGSPTSPEDLGKGLAALSASFDGQGKTTEQLLKIFEVMVAQGDKGSINTAALAQSGEKIFGAILTKGFATQKGVVGAGALLQTAATGATTEGAITNFKAFLDAMIQNQGKLAKAGFDPLTEGGFFKPIDELVAGITSIKGLFSGGKVNQAFIKTLVPEKKARDLYSVLAQQSLQGENAPFRQFYNEGQNASGNFTAKYKRLFSEGSTQFTRMGNLGSKLGERAFEPIINDMVKSLERLLADPAALKQLEETFRAFGDLLVLAGKGTGFIARTLTNTNSRERLQADLLKSKGELKNLPKYLQDRVKGENKRASGFFGELSSEEQKRKFISDVDRITLNLSVVVDKDGNAVADLESPYSDLGSKKIKVSKRK
jgi:hypothetical protein